MTAVNGWLIAGLVVLAYVLVVALLYRSGRIGPDRALSLFGPALMLKTQRGKQFLDRVGRFRRFWTRIGDLGILLAAVAMVVIVALLLLDAIVASTLPASSAPSPSEALGLPGINPIIPLGYGIVALIVGVVLHELMHGIVARSQKIGVKSIGVLWLVVPIGAFVEQDDVEMMQAPRRQRDRVAAAGVLANFALTVAFFLVLSGLVASSVQPNADGVGVGGVVAGYPAGNASLAPGDIILSLNGTSTTTDSQLLTILSHARAGQTMEMTYYRASDGTTVRTNVTLASLSRYTGVPADAKKGFLGVAPTFLTPSELRDNLVWPISNPSGPVVGAVYWLVLPLAGLEPLQGSNQQFYHFSGPLAGMSPANVWLALNLLYWLAWMNLLLGLSNALPMYPLDGGLLFRDFTASIARWARRGWDEARLEQFGGRATAVASVTVLGLLVWQFVAPYL